MALLCRSEFPSNVDEARFGIAFARSHHTACN